MDSMEAFARGKAARAAGNKKKVFDWNKAAQILRDSKVRSAAAGLSTDLEWTSGDILADGKPVTDCYTFLSSVWATPVLIIDGEEIDCYLMEDECPGWGSGTRWPESALAIFNGVAE